MQKQFSVQEAVGSLFQHAEAVSLGSGKAISHEFYGMYEAKWFIEKLYGTKSLGQLTIFAKDSGDNAELMLIDSAQSVAIAHYVVGKSKERDMFFCIGVINYNSVNEKFRGPKGVITVPGLWMNIKIQDPVKKEKWLPKQKEAVKFLHEAGDLKPTFIIDTVDEVQAYWVLKEPYIVDSRAKRDNILKTSNEFQNIYITAARRQGWNLDNTSSVINLQRLPGTWNRSFNPPEPITILEVNDK